MLLRNLKGITSFALLSSVRSKIPNWNLSIQSIPVFLISQERTLTLMIHADGAPLIRSSHQSLWPLFANIVEIPPPFREYQRNILLLALWSSRKKPDVDVFLNAVLAQLETLMQFGTTICIGNQEYYFIVRVQGFIADLPAKSLFLKTINFNGNNACTWCLTPGMLLVFTCVEIFHFSSK